MYIFLACKTLATIVGVKTLKGISLKENVVTIKASLLADKVSVSGCEFDFAAGSYKGKLISGSKDNDIIFSFDENDTLTLDSIDFTATYKNKVVTLKFDNGSITLKDFTSTRREDR